MPTKQPGPQQGSLDSDTPSFKPVPSLVPTAIPGGNLPSLRASTTTGLQSAAMYSGVILAATSLVLLIGFHQLAVDTTVVLPGVSLWSGPNTWELLLYSTYLQHISSLAHLPLQQAPEFFWRVSDSFSWCSFLIQETTLRTAFVIYDDGKDTAPTSTTTTTSINGVEAFANRNKVEPSSLLVHGLVGVLIVLGLLCILFVLVLIVCPRRGRENNTSAAESSTTINASSSSIMSTRVTQRGVRVLGLIALLWFASLYPLSMLAAFEISREDARKDLNGLRLSCAVLVLGLVLTLSLKALSSTIYRKSVRDLARSNTRMMWGAFYADVSFGVRCFFVVTALVQIILGLAIGAVRSFNATTMIIILGVLVVYLLVLICVSPFNARAPFWFTIVVILLQVINYALCAGFLESNNSISDESRERIANAIITMNLIVLIVWLLRHIFMLVALIRLFPHRQHVSEETDIDASREDGLQRSRSISVEGEEIGMITSPQLSTVHAPYLGAMMSPAP
ncbi:hypothetical protein Poli38472_003832 [Pythium oligandrum]|uniref:TRP C-terminal domain-containing protein n=1 Tax=Pythium oligandrum TaxID=41045 RepID=A0A8K1CM55_PYTOL|nr:hypothetical protein Poli38472_003832 [Pythium oligandrum]|eukprot:TMW66067.1 hypothetical protein Poli38472_003832 [Pythium oligandrum]